MNLGPEPQPSSWASCPCHLLSSHTKSQMEDRWQGISRCCILCMESAANSLESSRLDHFSQKVVLPHIAYKQKLFNYLLACELVLVVARSLYCCCLSLVPSGKATDLYKYSPDAVPPIHTVSYHVATDKDTAQDGDKFRSIFSDDLQPIATRRKKHVAHYW